MIVDTIQNYKTYAGFDRHFKEAFEFALTLKDRAPGRYDYDGFPKDEVFCNVIECDTSDPSTGYPEGHKHYMDVQIVLEGGETMFYGNVDNLEIVEPYSEEKDFMLYERVNNEIKIAPGMFYVALPQDAHMPTKYYDGPGKIKKIVIKIKVD